MKMKMISKNMSRYLEPPWKPDAEKIKSGWTRCDTIVDLDEDADESGMSDISDVDDRFASNNKKPTKADDPYAWCSVF